jgi:hypothetical protein
MNKMAMNQLVANLNKYLPMAEAEVKEQGFIDNVFGYMVSGEVTVDVKDVEDENAIMSIVLLQDGSLDTDEHGKVKLTIVAIDNEGEIDILETAEPTIEGLENIVESYKEIIDNGGYLREEDSYGF